MSCRTPPGAKEEKCALVQSVTAEDRPNVGLTVVFYKAIGEDKKLLRVVVPLGVLLPTGLGLKIDGQDVGNAPFLKCSKRGCIAEVVLQDEVIKKMKSGGLPCSSSSIRPRPASAFRSRCRASATRFANLK